MNGCTFKAIVVTFTFLATMFLSALTVAASDPYKAKLGCMSCHQGEAMHSSDKAVKQKSR